MEGYIRMGSSIGLALWCSKNRAAVISWVLFMSDLGYLADNYYNFVDNLMKAANFHRLYFTHHMGEISQRDLNIFMTFMTSFQIDSLAHPNQ